MGGGGKSPSVPNIETRSIGDIYNSATAASIESLPKLVGAYQQYGPQYLQAARSMQQQFMPEQFSVMQGVSGDLTQALSFIGDSQTSGGTGLPASLTTQFQNNIRSAQAARGNAFGPASSLTEAQYLGQNAETYRHNVISEANQFLGISPALNPTSTLSLSSLGLSPASPGELASLDAQVLEPLRLNNQWDVYNAQVDKWSRQQAARNAQWQAAGQAASTAALMFL